MRRPIMTSPDRLAGAAVLALLTGLSPGQPAAQVAGTPQAEALARLEAASSMPVTHTMQLGIPASVQCQVRVPGATSLDQARGFLVGFADLYGIDDPDLELVAERIDDPMAEGQVVRFTQRYRGLPVFGAGLNVYLGQASAGAPAQVFGTSGAFFQPYDVGIPEQPPRSIDLIPAIDAAAAEAAALAGLGSSAPVVGLTRLVIHDPAVFGEPGYPRLAYRVMLGDAGRDLVLVDASNGDILLSYPTDKDGYFMLMLDAGGDNWCPDDVSIIGNHTGISSSDPDAALVAQGLAGVHQFFLWNFGRDSYDDAGGLILSYIDVGFVNAIGLPAPNAKARIDCGIGFSDGWGSVDVAAHEFTHLVTGETSQLEYAFQSGALNESFSDFVGVSVDTQDWLLAEDRPVGSGAIRDFQNPPTYNCNSGAGPCPDRMASYFYLDEDTDNGGVHTNSQIINKAFYLMIEGGPFGAWPVNAMGRDKTARIAYKTFTSLSSNATFQGARGVAILWAAIYASDGDFGFTLADVCTVRQAFHAVGIGPGDANCDGVADSIGYVDNDSDGIPDDGDFSGTVGDAPCTSGNTLNCDDNCPTQPNPGQEDPDGDGLGGLCDPDMDGDGIPNGSDLCPTIAGSCLDSDGDGLTDSQDPDDDDDGIPDDNGIAGYQPCLPPTVTGCDDNCRFTPNPNQTDGNADGIGDACDADVDGDGVWASSDNCPFDANPAQTDSDGDGLGDECDACPQDAEWVDSWTTGIPELGVAPQPNVPDTDGDGIPDACDLSMFPQAAVKSDGLPYHVGRSFLPGAGPVQIRVTAPAATAGIRLPLDWGPCGPDGDDVTDWNETVEVTFTDFPRGLSGWLENGRGERIRRLQPHGSDPDRSGFRIRPRCGEDLHFVVETTAEFPGDVLFQAEAVSEAADTANPFVPPDTGTFDPPVLADEDSDGLLDAIDSCPQTFDPTNADTDADGVGDVCDSCPAVANPGQQPVPLPPVTASADGSGFEWAESTAVDWVHGALHQVGSYALSGQGQVTGNHAGFADPRESTWYLFKRVDCGTWGSPDRDAALP